jgi:hypothetical protein
VKVGMEIAKVISVGIIEGFISNLYLRLQLK